MANDSGRYREPPAWLAAIPGYRGYHAKEQRRLADRALREDLARRVSTSAQQLQRVNADLARARRYNELGALDRLSQRLQHLADRLLTAPEGYRGLFDREQVDEDALEQLIAFDQALAGGVDRLNSLASSLTEHTPAPLLESPAGSELVDLTERLHRRLDARTSVISEGRALPPEEALAVLAEPVRPRPEITLRPGDAASYGDHNFLVDAVVTYRGDRAWTEYRLRDGSAERWLLATSEALILLEPARADAVTIANGDSATVGDQQYRLHAQGQATATLVGPSGQYKDVPVTYRDYRGESSTGEHYLAIREWGTERRILHGEPIERELLSVFPRA